MAKGWWRTPLFMVGVLFMMQAFPMPGPVRDAAAFTWPAGYHLSFPLWHLVFTPFCSVADALTVLSTKEQMVFQIWVIVLCFAGLGWRRGALAWIFWIAFVAWGAVVPHPMGRLVADNPRTLLIDFHSHSRASHDGRPSFTPEANMRWHREQGYNAAFITDHNRIESAEAAHAISMKEWRDTGYYSLMGEEISLSKTHLVLLGNHIRVDNRPYDSDFNHVLLFLRDMNALRWPVIASLPEYWLYHWGPEVQEMVDGGIGGFEIVNSAPKALDFPETKRRAIIALCQQHNLPMTGISDNHGYGYATAVWNAMTIPGWRRLDPDQLELTIVLLLKKQGAQAVQVLERAKFWPQNRLQLILSPLGNALVYLRQLTPLQRGIWALWIFAGCAFWRRREFAGG